MEYLIENQFLSLHCDKKRHCLYCFWKATTEHANWEDIKNSFLKYIDLIELNNPGYSVIDERKMEHVFSPREQKWIDTEITPRAVSAGIRGIAIVVSSHAYVEIATKLMMNEENVSKLEIKFVKTLEEAEAWIDKKNASASAS